MRFVFRNPLPALFACCFSIAALASEQDIAGLRLGMSPEQAKAALVAFGIDPGRIQESRSNFRYTDGVDGHDTEAFLDHLVADKVERRAGKRVVDNFNLFFSPPPQGGKLVLIRRQIDNPVDAPTVSDYRAALLEKHGKPDVDRPGSPLWLDPPEAVSCTVKPPQDAHEIMSSVWMDAGLQHLRNAKKVTHPSQCARMLQYIMPSSANQPAKRVTAVLSDVPGWGTAYLATLEWIEAQRQAAVTAREGKASKPKL